MNRVVQNKSLEVSLKSVLVFAIMICLISCQSNSENKSGAKEVVEKATDKIASAAPVSKSLENYNIAKKAYLKNANDADALIWYGRRTAYLGKYQEAIDIYTTGIRKHPKDARMYRHRGHRYISLRQYDAAIKDFRMAARLIQGQEDQVEQDGLPNDRNIPLSTLHGNIWYHLGLAYYLKNDMPQALSAFSNRTVTEKYDDNIVSGGHWLYMILRRLGEVEAANGAIKEVKVGMDVIENGSYYKMCQFYKGLISQEALVPEGVKASADDVLSYGLGNWYLYHQQDTINAKKHYQHLLENGNKYSFAYIAAEADWNRLFEE